MVSLLIDKYDNYKSTFLMNAIIIEKGKRLPFLRTEMKNAYFQSI